MYFKPSCLGQVRLENDVLKADKKACKKYGPCGVGEKALYLNSIFLDRRFYIPVTNIHRAYKRVAMSKGGFTGKGAFGSIPYLVVEYGNGEKVQCTFKFEQNLDLMLADIQRRHPHIKTISVAAAKRLAEAEAEKKARLKKDLTPTARQTITELNAAKDFLEKQPDLYRRLAAASKAKRVYEATSPTYKWVALACLIGGLVAAAFGIHSMLSGGSDYGVYFMLVGLGVVFLFASLNVLPTARNNRRAITRDLDKARSDMEAYLAGYPGAFPLPVRYAHPAALTRMVRSVAEGRADTVDEAFADLKAGLKALNADVQVSQEEYDEVVAIKPMFLLENYQ